MELLVLILSLSLILLIQSNYTLALDCSQLPESMNVAHGDFPKGCPGAVWMSGSPSKAYCTNSVSDGRFAWWEKCCVWDGLKCIPKSGIKLRETKIICIFI